MHVLVRVAAPLLAASLLGACAVAPRSQGGWNAPPAASGWPGHDGSVARPTASFGTVTGIELVRSGSGAATGTGAVIGGVAGAVAGRAMASSTTDKNRQRNVATAIGAAVGAVMGHQIERHHTGAAGVRVTVALDRGGSVTFDQRDAGDLRVGDRVRVDGERVMRAG